MMNFNPTYRALLDSLCTEFTWPTDAANPEYQKAKAKIERVLSNTEMRSAVGGTGYDYHDANTTWHYGSD